MKRFLLLPLSLACACLLPGGVAHAQTTTEAAKADGKAFARDKAVAAQDAATTAPDAGRVPNFGGVPSQSDYFDDPELMSREAASQASSSTGYRTMRDSMDRRARFAPQDLDGVIARSKTLSEDPLAYTSGMAIGGAQGRCVPLPTGGGSAGLYMATCNTGYTASEETRTCRITLEASVAPGTDYVYPGEPGAGVETLGKVWTGVGPFTHDDPRDRPPAVFGGDVTLHAGAGQQPYVLLPVIPKK